MSFQFLSERLRFAAPLIVLPLLLNTSPALAEPATIEDMNLYTKIAALNVCISRSADISFDKAVGIAGETIAQVILGQHNGAIEQIGPESLTIEELRKGSINSAAIGVVDICPKLAPDDVVDKVKAAIKANQGSKNTN